MKANYAIALCSRHFLSVKFSFVVNLYIDSLTVWLHLAKRHLCGYNVTAFLSSLTKW